MNSNSDHVFVRNDNRYIFKLNAMSIVRFRYLNKFANTSMYVLHAVFQHNRFCGMHSMYVSMALPASTVNNMAAQSILNVLILFGSSLVYTSESYKTSGVIDWTNMSEL